MTRKRTQRTKQSLLKRHHYYEWHFTSCYCLWSVDLLSDHSIKEKEDIGKRSQITWNTRLCIPQLSDCREWENQEYSSPNINIYIKKRRKKRRKKKKERKKRQMKSLTKKWFINRACRCVSDMYVNAENGQLQGVHCDWTRGSWHRP